MKVRLVLVRSLRACVLPAVATLFLGACAGPAGPGPGAAAPIAPEARTELPKLVPTAPPADLNSVERFAWQQVVRLGETFAAGDAEAFLARVSRGFYRSYTTLETSLKALLEDSTALSCVVAVRAVTEEEGRVGVRAEWTRSVTRRDGSVDSRRGETEFLFLKSDTSLRLLDYRGDPPFAIDGI